MLIDAPKSKAKERTHLEVSAVHDSVLDGMRTVDGELELRLLRHFDALFAGFAFELLLRRGLFAAGVAFRRKIRLRAHFGRRYSVLQSGSIETEIGTEFDAIGAIFTDTKILLT